MHKLVKAGLVWLALILADQWAKLWALGALRGKDPIVVIRGVLELRYLENRGAAFGIFQNRQGFFILVTIIVLAGLFFLYGRIPEGQRYLPMKICFCLIGAGAAGNLIDRVFRSYVVDFIYFRLIDFPIFNVADIYVTLAAFLLVLLILFYYKEEEMEWVFSFRKRKEKEDEQGPGTEI